MISSVLLTALCLSSNKDVEKDSKDNNTCLKCDINMVTCSSEKWVCYDGCGVWKHTSKKRMLYCEYCATANTYS